MLMSGGVPHMGHAVAYELICLPHCEHWIKAIEGYGTGVSAVGFRLKQDAVFTNSRLE